MSETAPTSYTHVADLLHMQAVPEKGTLSRTIQQDEHTKVVLFGFAAGEELSEHTASMPAIMHFLEGRARVTVDADTFEATAGTWVHMPPHMRHSIRADTPLVMLLVLVKAGRVAER